VFQSGALPEWAESWLFKRLAAAGELDCSRPAGLSDILGDGSEDFVDLEDEVRHDGAVPASDGLGWNSSITSGGCVQRMPNDLHRLSPESLYTRSGGH
jgi:sugar lactone lactonase YvrE